MHEDLHRSNANQGNFNIKANDQIIISTNHMTWILQLSVHERDSNIDPNINNNEGKEN